jgi:hypothetical protein
MAGLIIASSSTASTGATQPPFSVESKRIAEWVRDLRKPSPASLPAESTSQQSKAHIFDALAAVKIKTALVAMHLDAEWRKNLFGQLDSLHDPAEWEVDEEPITESSFDTFLKAILDIKPERRPGLGLSPAGNLIAAWTTGRDRLTIEFLPNDLVRWVLSVYRDNEPIRIAGQMPVSRLVEQLALYEPKRWFSRESKNHQSPG